MVSSQYSVAVGSDACPKGAAALGNEHTAAMQDVTITDVYYCCHARTAPVAALSAAVMAAAVAAAK